MRLAWFACLLIGVLHAAEPRECARCHVRETAHFDESGMAQALHPASEAIRSPKQGRAGGYTYSIVPQQPSPVYSVSDGATTLQFPLTWAVGNNAAGQTYLFEHEGRWYESRLSAFPGLPSLDLTMGAQNITPHSLLEHAGRTLSNTEVTQCLGCHSTNAATPGIQCERCHGSTTAHVAKSQPMRHLGRLNAQEQADFCGQCHRTWADIAAGGPHDIQNLRFQPYRLASSKCFDPDDARIRCTACHDPHRELVTNVAAYDAKCQACHSTAAKHKLCKTAATHGCVKCHMPRVELPGAHTTFTDHWIRIARPGAPYPG